ncbi:MAG: type II toxin-antitoxin system ParD family antitoxin [Pseudomonadota bacterium]
MNVSVGDRWESFVQDVVKAGRYGSASEVVREGLRLVEEREEKLKALRDKVNDSIARGGAHSPDDVRAYVKDRFDPSLRSND